MRIPTVLTLVLGPIACGILVFCIPFPSRSSGLAGAEKAFTAQTKVEVAEDGKTFRTVSNGVFYRDSSGRTRVDAMFASKDGRPVRRTEITIPDRDSLVRYSLDADRLTGTRHSSPLPKETDMASPTQWRVRHFQSLGSKKFEGLDCFGLRYGPAPVATHYDVWRCEPGHVNVEPTYYRANGSIERETMYSIHFAEPSPSLFDTSGYKLDDHSRAGSHPTTVCTACSQKPAAARKE